MLYEEENNLDYLDNHGAFVPGVAFPAVEILSGNGRHEEGTV